MNPAKGIQVLYLVFIGVGLLWYCCIVVINYSLPLAYSNLANVFSQKGDSMAAEQAYKSALQYRPNMADAHYNL